ncbi:MAG TPA: tryptophan synthase subunit alpha [Candidatus Saccharimonadia bacterium]|jgi:tryptophan synthase alpha subunit|nr:tryptophan synthase subunit alpha [Candidatus Saccharimonadia bacterium]
MNKIDETLKALKAEGRTGLMTHVVVGYPDLAATAELVRTMVSAGADMVELQIPFSDPLADGPTIQRACEAALERSTRVADAFTLARELSGEVQAPLLFMAYFNTVFKYGVERFCRDAAAAGISGLIVPDVPLEADEHEGFSRAGAAAGVRVIRTVSPLSTPARLAKNAAAAGGFVYAMTRQGVTGTAGQLDPEVAAYLDTVRREFSVPVAAGFGISGPERFAAIAPHCDVAVVGSAVLDIVNAAAPAARADKVAAFIRELTGEKRS